MPGAGSLREGGAEVAPSPGAREAASASAYLGGRGGGGGVEGKGLANGVAMVSTAASQQEGLLGSRSTKHPS